MIEERFHLLLVLSERLEVYVAVDGFQEVHDAIRGRGVFERVMRGVDRLLKAGAFKGKVTNNCVMTDRLVSRVYGFVGLLQYKGVDAVYLSFPWYLSEETCRRMDRRMARDLPDLLPGAGRERPSWRAYKHRIDLALFDALARDLDRENAETWSVKLRCNPGPDRERMPEFLSGGSRPAQRRSRCLALKSRMDVLPDGRVFSCKFFPEFTVDDLTWESVHSVWSGAKFRGLREEMDRTGLMLVCSHCNLPYSRGV